MVIDFTWIKDIENEPSTMVILAQNRDWAASDPLLMKSLVGCASRSDKCGLQYTYRASGGFYGLPQLVSDSGAFDFVNYGKKGGGIGMNIMQMACSALDNYFSESGGWGSECKLVKFISQPKLGSIERISDQNGGTYSYYPTKQGRDSLRFVVENGQGRKVDCILNFVTRRVLDMGMDNWGDSVEGDQSFVLAAVKTIDSVVPGTGGVARAELGSSKYPAVAKTSGFAASSTSYYYENISDIAAIETGAMFVHSVVHEKKLRIDKTITIPHVVEQDGGNMQIAGELAQGRILSPGQNVIIDLTSNGWLKQNGIYSPDPTFTVTIDVLPNHGRMESLPGGEFRYTPHPKYVGRNFVSFIVNMEGKKIRTNFVLIVTKNIEDPKGQNDNVDAPAAVQLAARRAALV